MPDQNRTWFVVLLLRIVFETHIEGIMKRIRTGIMRKQFDILPTLTIRWFIGYEGTRKFDIGCSWLCFYAQSNNFGRDRLKAWKMQQNELRIKYNIK